MREEQTTSKHRSSFDLTAPVSTLPHILEDAIIKPLINLPRTLENSIGAFLTQPTLPPTPPEDSTDEEFDEYDAPGSLFIRGETLHYHRDDHNTGSSEE